MAGSADFEQLQELEQLLKLYPEFKQLDEVLLHFPAIDEAVTKDITDQAFATQYVKMLYAQQENPAVPTDTYEQSTRLKSPKRVFLKWTSLA